MPTTGLKSVSDVAHGVLRDPGKLFLGPILERDMHSGPLTAFQEGSDRFGVPSLGGQKTDRLSLHLTLWTRYATIREKKCTKDTTSDLISRA